MITKNRIHKRFHQINAILYIDELLQTQTCFLATIKNRYCQTQILLYTNILYNFYHFIFCNAVINDLYNNAFTHSAPKPKRTNSQFINNNYQPCVSNRIQLYMFVVMTKVLNKFVVIIGMIRCRYCRGNGLIFHHTDNQQILYIDSR